jgi:hypothetical protein
MTVNRPLDLVALRCKLRRPPKRGLRRWLRWLAVVWGFA